MYISEELRIIQSCTRCWFHTGIQSAYAISRSREMVVDTSEQFAATCEQWDRIPQPSGNITQCSLDDSVPSDRIHAGLMRTWFLPTLA